MALLIRAHGSSLLSMFACMFSFSCFFLSPSHTTRLHSIYSVGWASFMCLRMTVSLCNLTTTNNVILSVVLWKKRQYAIWDNMRQYALRRFESKPMYVSIFRLSYCHCCCYVNVLPKIGHYLDFNKRKTEARKWINHWLEHTVICDTCVFAMYFLFVAPCTPHQTTTFTQFSRFGVFLSISAHCCSMAQSFIVNASHRRNFDKIGDDLCLMDPHRTQMCTSTSTDCLKRQVLQCHLNRFCFCSMRFRFDSCSRTIASNINSILQSVNNSDFMPKRYFSGTWYAAKSILGGGLETFLKIIYGGELTTSKSQLKKYVILHPQSNCGFICLYGRSATG